MGRYKADKSNTHKSTVFYSTFSYHNTPKTINLEQVIFCWVLCGKSNTQYYFIKKKKEKD
jgi:hypothetical protein